MSCDEREEIAIYRRKLEENRHHFEAAVGEAVQQRIFVVWCALLGLPIADLVAISNRTLDNIGKMKEALDDIETCVDVLEFMIDIKEGKMTENDVLYNMFNQANEARKRKNFDTFMSSLKSNLTIDLDKAYASDDKAYYEQILKNIKSQGIKVFRNSQGKHKLQLVTTTESRVDD